VNNKKSKGEQVNNLTDITDYYSEKNKITPTFNIDSIYINDCGSKGKIYIVGKSTDDITEKISFDLPLTYPTAEIKCELDQVSKNVNINITCKSQTKFENVENLIIESRLIKKKNQEIIFIQGKQINFGAKKECENYNTIKLQTTKKRQNSKYTFLQLNKYTPRLNGLYFFMALLRNSLTTEFVNSYRITIKIIISSRRNLRMLDESTQSSISVLCNLNETLQTNLSAGYDCSNNGTISGTPSKMEIETENITDISGIPENKNQEELKGNIDYSNLVNLQKIDELPVVNITNITGDTCTENGQYIITAKIVEQKTNTLKNKYQNVEMRLSIPESSALCSINVNDIITMTCENKDKFDESQILIEKSVIKDQKGNDIFIVNSFTNLEVFGCDISYNSAITPVEEDGIDTVIPSYVVSNNTRYIKKKNSGLSGGAIAGIVIACVVAVAAVTAIIILGKNGIFSRIPQKKFNYFWSF